MYFLNLTLLQFAALFGSISAVSVALYLLDRSRRKQIVSTLRFWMAAEQPAVAARRRRVQQPWSLILQLVSMALLLLAIAQLRFGAPLQAGQRDLSRFLAPRPTPPARSRALRTGFHGTRAGIDAGAGEVVAWIIRTHRRGAETRRKPREIGERCRTPPRFLSCQSVSQ